MKRNEMKYQNEWKIRDFLNERERERERKKEKQRERKRKTDRQTNSLVEWVKGTKK